MRKKGSLLVWLFDICGLQFGIVREVCSHLVLVLRFDDLLSLSMLQLLDLICGSLFGLCAIRIWYLVFVFGVCELLVFWFCICEKENYLRLGFVRVLLHQFVLSQIYYSEICLMLPVNISYC